MGDHHEHGGFQGPRCWIISMLVGLVVGFGLTRGFTPGDYWAQAPADTAHGETHAAHDPHHEHAHDEHHVDGHREDVHAADGHDGPTSHDDHHIGNYETKIEIVSAGDALDGIMVPDPHAHDGTHATHDEHQTHNDHDKAEHGSAHGDDHGGAHGHGHPAPEIPIWLVAPFALLLLSIALMPFINERFWHAHFPDFAFFFGGITVAYYLLGFDQPGYAGAMSYGQYKLLHAAQEYYAFIALIGGLFVASGGVLINVKGKGGPVVNASILLFGAVLANIVGTTGASVLLIRPFMRVNKGRLKPIHIVMFIFIVSNCGGALTPIGDPPLYLGYLKGVPFFWTVVHLWPMWLVCIATLITIFTVIDMKIGPARTPTGELVQREHEKTSVSITGASGMIALGLIILGVFIDPMLIKVAGIAHPPPVGPTFQILVAVGAYFIANRDNHRANDFNFFPVKEVGLLFVGIFATMTPALGYLAEHGAQLGLNSPTAFYFGTGALSGMLDNAPTYLNFLQVAFGSNELNPDNIATFLGSKPNVMILEGISLGAVFFGAMTYIGNGPNFMVKAIAEAGGVKMPSFFGYVARAVLILTPVLAVIWLLFFFTTGPEGATLLPH